MIIGVPTEMCSNEQRVAVVPALAKLGLSPGFSGISNPLFAADNAVVLFGDAKVVALDLTTALKEA